MSGAAADLAAIEDDRYAHLANGIRLHVAVLPGPAQPDRRAVGDRAAAARTSAQPCQQHRR